MGVEDAEVVVGTVGRLVEEKGYLELFAAAGALTAREVPARFVVVGPHDPDKADGLSQGVVSRAADEVGVVFLGMRDDVERLYPAMDVFVLASHREGFPRAAMEAAAMGLPIVATDIRGCRQVVDDGVNGRLVPVRDADALAGAIGELVEDRRVRKAMGVGSRDKARSDFDDRTQVQVTLDRYEALLNGGNGPQLPL